MKSSLYIAFAATILFSSFTLKKENKLINDQTEKTQTTIDRDSIISYAKQYLGIHYLYAGNDPKKGFDCSGFVNYVFKHFDVSVPRSSSGYKNLGVSKKPEDFKVGDVLVFYGYKNRTVVGHVGIICEANGMNSKFIHASSGKAGSVTISDLDSDHYSKRYYKCVDVLP
ncbi:C40 family peptidase [Flavobacterium piscisymbiosum]|jgi:cell wall-associated NlpC family hydrolase|uniref:C40 family peptidase n=1 Tax=Flavobacterium piscisymbiosum TaxID=2893753 RepID=A0ABS8MPL7_9FLAO|nr:C40 family peptidase [Flavobacterium sp. F-30]MCC9066605.1 C40 family peptidase [Flavobacterium sp. F-30]